MHEMTNQTTWSSRMVFLMAAVGAAVGLGNIWKFPYTAGVSGGGAFVLIYVVAILAVAVPLVMAELMIGRRARRSPVNSFRSLSKEAGASSRWRWIGIVNVTAVFMILSFYSVIAGWALAYIPKIATGVFTGADGAEVNGVFDAVLAAPLTMSLWHGLFIVLTALIVGRGVQRGIERAVKLLMPSLFVMLLLLVGYAAVAGNLGAALEFLFAVDFAKVDGTVVLNAVGQAFFSVSVAMGLLIAYGAYLPDNVQIPRAALIIAGADTLVALLAGLAIFPIVFANGLDAAQGPGLIFVTLPLAFGGMPAGALFGTIFFVLLVFAALTSSIAIMEPMVSWAAEDRGMGRGPSAALVGFAAWLLGLATVFSFNLWSDFHPLAALSGFESRTIFDIVDFLASNVLLPFGGMLIAFFVGWVMTRSATREELGLAEGPWFTIWVLLVRFAVPVAVGAVLVYAFVG